MLEATFISNKTKKRLVKYSFVIVFAVITWILQLSLFSRFLIFDSSPNVIYLGTIFSGIVGGPLIGGFFGIISSFLSCSILHDHIFYVSYPLIGFAAGVLTKSNFADEFMLFIMASIAFVFVLEMLNGVQYSLKHDIDIVQRYILLSFSGVLINVFFAPFFYWFMKILTNKSKIR